MHEKVRQGHLRRFPALRLIPLSEWDEFFEREGQPWTLEEEVYVEQWFGLEDTMSIAYALGRLPRSIRSKAWRLGVRGNMSRVPGRFLIDELLEV